MSNSMRVGAVPVCRNGHARVNPDGSSNVYSYPPREGRKPRITCRICRDGLPRERQDRPNREPTIFEEFDLRPVRSRMAERELYGDLRRLGLINAWATGLELEAESITVDFFVAMIRRYGARHLRALRLLNDAMADSGDSLPSPWGSSEMSRA